MVRRDPYLSVDHAATLAEAAGVAPPYVTDGQSMLHVARRGDQGWPRPVLAERTPRVAGGPPTVLGVRTSRYLYLRWLNGEEELFDVAADPQERHNLLAVAEHAEELDLLRTTLDQLKDCIGTDCNPPIHPALTGTG